MEPIIRAIISISVLIVMAKLLGSVFESLKMPTVLGELFAGMVFGPYALGGVIEISGVPLVEFNEIIYAFAEIGAIIVLFVAGLEMTFAQFKAAGFPSLVIGTAGVAIPFAMGYWLYMALGFSLQSAIIVGAALTATSIAISVRTLEEIGKLSSREGTVLVNSAVIDDVLSLSVLALVISVVEAGVVPSFAEMIFKVVWALILWLLLILIGVYAIPRFVDQASLMKVEGSMEVVAIASCFGMAALAAGLGLSPLVGAFAAGMAMASSRIIVKIRLFIRHIMLVFSPIFFGVMGASVNPAAFSSETAVIMALLVAVALFSKVAGCGLPAALILKDKVKGLRVGIGMASRGEVGLIVGGAGLTAGVIAQNLYVQIVGMVIFTTIITPIVLERSFTRLKAGDEVLREIPLEEPTIFDEYFKSKDLDIVRGLTIAIELEIKSRNYYQAKSSEVKNQAGKILLRFLADEELEHMKVLDQVKRKLVASNKWIEIGETSLREMERPRIFEGKPTEPRVEANSADEDILLVAMSAELRAEEYYSKMSEKVEDVEGRGFFQTLAKFEREHYEMIKELLEQ
ncbi:MAG: hypothetical protein GTO54_08765 [Nitrososphaeria archaeon]|nr:hypothetical protein [Nitrososphaeria archaeon]NIN53067.1 hypothetical protein [Nitrososphaeria archaeon]